MNYRNGISILLLLVVSAIAEEGVAPLRVLSVIRITNENHLYSSAPVGSTKVKSLQIDFPAYQVYHCFPGAEIYGQTVESVDMEARTVKMTDGVTKVFPTEKTVHTNIPVVSLSTGEIWWGEPGNTLSNQLTIIEVNENDGIVAESPVYGRVIIPKATVPELQELGKQESQSGPAYPPQGVGSPDP